MPTSQPGFSLFYVDDSGSPDAGYVTYSWLRIGPPNWGEAEQRWLRFRQRLHDRYAIPASARLHATNLAGARDRPTRDPAWRRSSGLDVLRAALDTIAALPGVSIGTVFRPAPAGGSAFTDAKYGLYGDMVAMLNRGLGERNAYGMIIIDGDDDPAYTRSHRALGHRHRHLIEAPGFRHASTSQWVQIADLIAWTAHRSLRPAGPRNPAKDWYTRTLGHLDPAGGPLPL